MAKLVLAMPYLRSNEGGWAYIVGDRGGMTYMGISRTMQPNWPGWVIIDKLNLPIHQPHTCDQILASNPAILSLVLDFYQKTYWCYDGLVSQQVATKLFDGAVNMEGNGRHGSAIKALQLAIGLQSLGCKPDGNYGPTTESLANQCESVQLLKDMAHFFSEHYKEILAANPGDARFREDWLRRAAKLPV